MAETKSAPPENLVPTGAIIQVRAMLYRSNPAPFLGPIGVGEYLSIKSSAPGLYTWYPHPLEEPVIHHHPHGSYYIRDHNYVVHHREFVEWSGKNQIELMKVIPASRQQAKEWKLNLPADYPMEQLNQAPPPNPWEKDPPWQVSRFPEESRIPEPDSQPNGLVFQIPSSTILYFNIEEKRGWYRLYQFKEGTKEAPAPTILYDNRTLVGLVLTGSLLLVGKVPIPDSARPWMVGKSDTQ